MPNSWLASKEEIQKTVSQKAKHRQIVQAKLGKMRRTGLPKLSHQEVFATKEAAQKALSVKAEYLQSVQSQILKMRSKNYSQL
jgi:phosphopantetheinyl transferase (holo-ACP synthase)